MFDFENGTQYMKQHNAMKKQNKTKYACVPFFENIIENAHDNAHDTQTEIATTTHEIESSSFERITTNNGTQRTIIGNYNDNRVMIKKSFEHLNSMKRAMSLSNTTNDENTRLRNENIMYRELLNLELTLRKMNNNINNENE
jgi:hypothetical protein